MPTLSIQLPGLPPVSHVLKDETITIGRMKGNTIVIEDSSISLMHAKITRKNGDFLLKDLNSTNGTIVNGQPIGEVRLRDMDRVRFAEITCQFLPDAPTAPDQIQTQQISIPPRPAAPLQVASAPPPPVAAPSTPAAALPVAAAPPPTPLRNAPIERQKRAPLFFLRFAIPVVVVASLSFAAWKIFQVNQDSLEKVKARGSTQTLSEQPVGSPQKMPSFPPKSAERPKVTSELANNASDGPSPAPGMAKPITGQNPTAQKEGVPQLIQSLKNDDPTERQRAAAALHSLGPEAKEAIPALREALTDKDHEVQMWAALALVNNQEYDKGVVPVLVRVLQHDNPVLRQVACLSLGLIPYSDSEKTSVIPALTETAGKDGNEDVRRAAASALSIIAPEAIGKTAAK